MSFPLSSQDRELLIRLALAESRSEGVVGMALVIRSVLNRQAAIRNGANFGTNGSTEIRDIIYARNQYAPTTDRRNSIDQSFSSQQFKDGAKALELSEVPLELQQSVESNGFNSTTARNLVLSTGFDSLGGQGRDGVIKYRNHFFVENVNNFGVTGDSIFESSLSAGTQPLEQTEISNIPVVTVEQPVEDVTEYPTFDSRGLTYEKREDGWYIVDDDGATRVVDAVQESVQIRYEAFLESRKKTSKPPCPPDSTTVGQTVIMADPCKDNTLARVEAYLSNFFDKVTQVGNAVLNLGNEINFVVDLIGDTITGFTNKMLGSLNDALSEIINQGIDALTKLLISLQYPIPAIIGILTPLIPLVQSLVDGIFCAAKNVVDGAKDVMKDLITGAVKNVLNAGQCVVEQIMGAFTNNLVNIVDSIVGPLLNPISSILNGFGANIFGFNLKDFLLTGINAIKKISNLFDCGEEPTCPSTSKYKIAQGPFKDMSEEEEDSSWNRIFSGTAISQGAENFTNEFEQKYGKWNVFGAPLSETGGIGPCEFGNITKCGAPTFSFFGGDGTGAAGEVILGSIIDNVDTEDSIGSILKVGSIVGVNITEPGSGYGRPPIVTFQDSCNRGYGAYGRAIIEQNPRSPKFGQVISVVITSEGVDYPADIDELPLYITDVVVENPGQGYDEDNVVIEGIGIDDIAEGFEVTVENGQVKKVSVVPGFAFNGLPDLNILSTTGFGAVLRPIMSVVTPQTEIIQVIDCVS